MEVDLKKVEEFEQENTQEQEQAQEQEQEEQKKQEESEKVDLSGLKAYISMLHQKAFSVAGRRIEPESLGELNAVALEAIQEDAPKILKGIVENKKLAYLATLTTVFMMSPKEGVITNTRAENE